MNGSVASLFAVFTVACSSSASSASGPAQACFDTADAVGKAAQRCGEDYQANHDAFEQIVGGCDHIVKVRDEASLRGTCLPSLETVSCSDLLAARLDESCRAQLER
jgi:hypothetical protein